jgi:hypothetical protein
MDGRERIGEVEIMLGSTRRFLQITEQGLPEKLR